MASVRTIRYVRKIHYRRALLASSLWRDNFSIANTYVLPQATPRLTDFRVIEDRRTFMPNRRYRTLQGGRARVSFNSRFVANRGFGVASFRVSHGAPSRVLVCIRRSQRREVMFAMRKAGRKGQRRPKFSETSKIYC